MPYKKIDPASEETMLNQKYDGHHTICQTLREIYVMSGDDDIKLKLRLAMAMAKRMQDKLKEYKTEKERRENNGKQ